MNTAYMQEYATYRQAELRAEADQFRLARAARKGRRSTRGHRRVAGLGRLVRLRHVGGAS